MDYTTKTQHKERRVRIKKLNPIVQLPIIIQTHRNNFQQQSKRTRNYSQKGTKSAQTQLKIFRNTQDSQATNLPSSKLTTTFSLIVPPRRTISINQSRYMVHPDLCYKGILFERAQPHRKNTFEHPCPHKSPKIVSTYISTLISFMSTRLLSSTRSQDK